MPVLAPTKGQKKAAKRAAKKQGLLAAEKVASSNVEYTVVGTIKPERLEKPAIPPISTHDSTPPIPTLATLAHQRLVSVTPNAIAIATASPIPTVSRQVPPLYESIPLAQSAGSPPTLSTLPLESLGSFDPGFTFGAFTRVSRFHDRSEFFDASNHERTSSRKASRLRPLPHAPMDPQPVDEISARLATWACTEATRLYYMQLYTASEHITPAQLVNPINFAESTINMLKLETRNDPQQSLSEYEHQKWALVSYYHISPIKLFVDYTVDRNFDKSLTDLSLESILSSRIFLASAHGVIQCIDYDQLLHDVETTQDDGGSDFDSVASPTKKEIRSFNDEYYEVSEDFGSGFDESELGIAIPNTFHDVEDTAKRNNLKLPVVNGSTFVFHGCSVYCIHEETSKREGVSVYVDDSGLDSKDAKLLDAEGCAVVVSQQSHLQPTECPVSKTDATFVGEPAKRASTISQAPEASDWAYELIRMRLGTESLFSYLKVLKVEESGNATRVAVVTAFLKLVNRERKKHEAHSLPLSCTAYSVLNSGILPHTTMLGTTTVAALVAQLVFDEKDEVEIVKVYAAWDRLGREEMRQQQKAAMGIMGALGRALGRLT